MTYIVLLFTVFLIHHASAACGPNEVEKEGIDCTSDCCPEPKCQPSSCPDQCASACKCSLQYLRAANGTCIPARECPEIPCGENEVFDRCPNTFCSDKCSSSAHSMENGERRCKFFGIGPVVICRPACRCVDSYYRNDANECVYYDQCPQLQTDCE